MLPSHPCCIQQQRATQAGPQKVWSNVIHTHEPQGTLTHVALRSLQGFLEPCVFGQYLFSA